MTLNASLRSRVARLEEKSAEKPLSRAEAMREARALRLAMTADQRAAWDAGAPDRLRELEKVDPDGIAATMLRRRLTREGRLP